MSDPADLQVFALKDFPLVKEGDDVGDLIVNVARAQDLSFEAGDIIVIAQKIISKSEGRLINLCDVRPGEEALRLAKVTDKDARLVELILSESVDVIRAVKDVLIVAHRLGFVHANAGIDQSNVGATMAGEVALMLPEDPDESARRIRARLMAETGVPLGIVINDSMGRAWRCGTVGLAIGCAGLVPLSDQRGEPDLFDRKLEVTEVGWADEIAAAASFVMGQGREGVPVVIVRGAGAALDPGGGDGPGISALLRPADRDLFRT